MMDPLALSMRQRDCIFAFQNRREPTNRVDIWGCARHKLSRRQPASVCVWFLMSGCNVKLSGVSALLPRSLSPAMLAIMPGIAGHAQMSVERGRVFQTPCILAVS